MKKILLTIIVLTLGLSETYSQEFSKNGVFFDSVPIVDGKIQQKTGLGSLGPLVIKGPCGIIE